MGFTLWIVLIISVFIFIISRKSKIYHITSILTSSILLLITGILTKNIILYGKVEYTLLGGIFYIDYLSIIVLDIVLIISFMASIYSVGYLEEELKHSNFDYKRMRLYYMLMYLFIFTMVLALTVRNIGIIWIAIEATTLASAFLVGFNNDKKAIEAVWKYVIICSVGIAIALLGIILLHLSSVGVIPNSNFLDWPTLFNNAKDLKSPILRFSFIFIIIGFGTKAGLAPMHTWLPDAHSQAYSPISALLSGVLLNSAMYAIIRSVSIVNKNLGSSVFTGRILIATGILSITTAAIFILTQKDYKRLLAYSSIEHMGIIALALGIFTPTSIFAALFHMINHSFTKSMLFFSSGSILQKYGSKEISKISNLLKILPITGTVFMLGLFAIAGIPPFSVFSSELNIIAAIFETKGFLIGSMLIILIAVIFVGIAITLFKVFYQNDAEIDIKPGEYNIMGSIVTIVLLAIILITGMYMPYELRTLIKNAQIIIVGG